MYNTTEINKEKYTQLMLEIQRLNTEYKSVRKSSEYKIGMLLKTTLTDLKKLNIKDIGKKYSRWINGAASKKYVTNISQTLSINTEHNFFSNEKIAVYTSVFGNYDSVPEPYCTPDNIDYYLITDQTFDEKESCWKKVDLSKFADTLNGLTNSEKNRFFKMHPDVLFPEYKYSIYIDGNIQIISDLTEFIYMIGTPGIAAHLHSMRDCVYDEGDAVIFAKKENRLNIQNHLNYITSTGMPRHYGLIECNVLVRDHSNPICQKIMGDWWKEYLKYSKRDQISFAHCLYMNNIKAEDVGTLGNNVALNPAIRVRTHL